MSRRSFARKFWPGASIHVGRHFNFAYSDRTVVGVVADVRVRGPERTAEPQVYLPYQQVPDSSIIGYLPKDLVIRSSLPTAALLPAVRRIVHSADAECRYRMSGRWQRVVAGQTASRSVQVRILGAFALIAILLAGVGIHGLLAYSVSQRSREFGVRLALGASSASILTLVIRQSVLLALAGLVPGIVLAYGAGRLLSSLLAGVQPGDFATFTAAVVLCGVMTVAGSLPPVLRAIRVDPNVVMRGE